MGVGIIKKDIAIVVENLIQFQYIENGINILFNFYCQSTGLVFHLRRN